MGTNAQQEKEILGEFPAPFSFLFSMLDTPKHEIKTCEKQLYQLALVTQKLSFLDSTLLQHLIRVVLL